MIRRASEHLGGPARLLLAVLATLSGGCATEAPPPPAPAPAPVVTPAPERPAPPPPRPRSDLPPLRLDGEPAFEIGLTWDVDSLHLEPSGAVPISWRSPRGESSVATLSAALDVRLSGAQALVWPRDRQRAVPLAALESGDTLWIGSPRADRDETPTIGWDGRTWRGRFKVFIGPRGRLTLATRVSLERYLLGVVPGEIGALRDSLLEAGRAQAIAARSYSLFYRGRRGAEGFDLYGTVEDQVYGSTESERPLASRCVQTTRGVIALSDEAPIRANYCSTCGGITAEAWEAWPTEARSYLTSHRDTVEEPGDLCAESPQYRWRESWTPAELLANVTRFAPGLGVPLPASPMGRLLDVRVLARSRSGRVWRLLVRTDAGDVEIPAYALRQLLRRAGRPEAILRSNLFKIGVRRDPATRVATAVVASGAGSGHGVGLCQTGALALARRGVRAEDILAHYYAGAELRRLY